MDISLALALTIAAALLQYLWARYSRMARTRSAVLIVAPVGALLLVVLIALRLNLTASIEGRVLGAADYALIAVIAVGYLVGSVLGAVMRERSQSLNRPS